MAVGSLGDITFEVSSDKVRTFDGFERSGSARLAFHERQGGKPLAEFVGPNVDSINIDIRFSVYDGVNPTEETKALRAARDNGDALLLVLDGEPQGVGYWLIENLSETPSFFDNHGCPAVIKCSVTLKEYVEVM